MGKRKGAGREGGRVDSQKKRKKDAQIFLSSHRCVVGEETDLKIGRGHSVQVQVWYVVAAKRISIHVNVLE